MSPLKGLSRPRLRPVRLYRIPGRLSVYASEVLADRPSAYWRLGEGSAAADKSGNGYTGTYTGGVTLAQAGALATELDGTLNTAVLLNGTSGYVSIPAAAVAFRTGDFTMELWAKTSSASASMMLVDHLAASGNQWFRYYLTAAGKAKLEIFATTAGAAGRAVNDGSWHHLAVSVSRTGNAVFYVDGVLDQTGDVSAASATDINNASNGAIGAAYDGASLWFPGSISEVALYPTALGAARVLAHYLAAF